MPLETADLSPVERALVDASLAGEPFEPAPGPRTVRAGVLRQLVLGGFGAPLPARGLQTKGIVVAGELNLEFLEALPPLWLIGCELPEGLVLRFARMPLLVLSGSHVDRLVAEQLVTVGDVVLSDGFAASAVDLDYARIGGSLICSGSRFGPRAVALSAEGADVRSDVRLDRGFRAQGSVLLGGISIGGVFDCSAGEFDHPDGHALNVAQAQIRSDVKLGDGFRSTGEVGLASAVVGGQVSCGTGAFRNVGGDALTADALQCRGVFLNRGFSAAGSVRLLGAQIEGQLDCSGASIDAPGALALNCDEARVTGGVFLDRGFAAVGSVSLLAARVGGQVSLTGSSIDSAGDSALLLDQAQVDGNVHLNDGFRAAGATSLVGATIGGQLVCTRGKFENRPGVALTMEGAHIGEGMLMLDAHIGGRFSVSRVSLSGVVSLAGLVHERSDPKAAAGVSLSGARFDGTTRLLFNTPLRLEHTIIRAPVTLRANRGERLESLHGASIEAPLTIEATVSLEGCTMVSATGLGNLRILGGDQAWSHYRRRRILNDERGVRGDPPAVRQISARAVEGSYREIRAALETSKAAPAAADFYYGEMEMRRLAASMPSVEWWLLGVYKVTSGYGLRASRALLSFALVVLAVAGALRLWTSVFVNDPAAATGIRPGGHGLVLSGFGDVVAFVARSSVSFLSPTTAGLTAWGTALMLLVRFAAPVFLALAALAVRARIQR